MAQIQWLTSLNEAMQRSKTENRLILLDFFSPIGRNRDEVKRAPNKAQTFNNLRRIPLGDRFPQRDPSAHGCGQPGQRSGQCRPASKGLLLLQTLNFVLLSL
jgi:hypothetical protein